MTGARLLVLLAVLIGCGGAARSGGGATAPTRAPCAEDRYWDGTACRPRGDGRALIDRGAAELAEFRVDEALVALEQAKARGPYGYDDHVRLYEQLGIAYAYLEREEDALAAFEMLLALDPGHLLSYTLSPRATFLFARTRERAEAAPRAAVDLSWPRELTTADRIPVDVEVVADPAGLLARATLHVRAGANAGDAADYGAVDLTLPASGSYQRIVLPALGAPHPATLELHLTAYDAAGNEVLRWAGPERPREIPLRYDPPTPWYRTWWVWAVAGTVAAAATAGTVYAVTREPDDTVGGQFEPR